MTQPQDETPNRIVIVGPDGQPVGEIPAPGAEAGDGQPPITELVEQPAKVMRIGTMIKQLLEEVRSAPLDEAGRARLKEIHRRSIAELEDGLAPELVDELERISLPFTDEGVPSEAELRIAQAQLVGWLEGRLLPEHSLRRCVVARRFRPGPTVAASRPSLTRASAPAAPICSGTSQPEAARRGDRPLHE
jgi:hypothetical protein